MRAAKWLKASRGYTLKFQQRNGSQFQLDNFNEDDLDKISSALEEKYKIELQTEEHALKGWNWGKTEFNGSELRFHVNNRNAFDLPLKHISNTNLTGKQEVSVEFELPGEEDGDDRDAKKAARDVDQMVEIRFYVPGVMAKDEEEGDDEEETEEQSAAQVFYDTLKDKADVGEAAGNAIAAFTDVVLLTPRYVDIQDLDQWLTPSVVDTTLTCTKLPCGYAGKRTTTKYSIQPSSTCFCSLDRTTRTLSLL